MFRSVLDKTLRENGYKKDRKISLKKQIDLATDDGVLTESRRKRAHEDIRVLGNDVLHDEWKEISEEDVEIARQYSQRILEDFYDDRETVEEILITKRRISKGEKGKEAPPPTPSAT